jgi:hypothetical protein
MAAANLINARFTAYRTRQSVAIAATEVERGEMTGGFIEVLEKDMTVPVYVNDVKLTDESPKEAWERFQKEDCPPEQFTIAANENVEEREWCFIKDQLYEDDRFIRILRESERPAWDQYMLMLPKGHCTSLEIREPLCMAAVFYCQEGGVSTRAHDSCPRFVGTS